MSEDLRGRVEQIIDSIIRYFNSDDRQSYAHWDNKLLGLELSLLESDSIPDRESLLASVLAQRIDLAFNVGKWDVVLEQSARFIHNFPASLPCFFLVATLRARTLHLTGAHQEELREVLTIARKQEVQGSEYVFLLENLSERHPGSIPSDQLFFAKLQETVLKFRALGYESLQPIDDSESQLEAAFVRVAKELRRVHRTMADTLLVDGDP